MRIRKIAGPGIEVGTPQVPPKHPIVQPGEVTRLDTSFALDRQGPYPRGTLMVRRSAPRGEWLAVRRRYIGSSDVARLFGVGKGGQFSVWANKTGRLPDGEMSLEAARGIEMEDSVVNIWVKH